MLLLIHYFLIAASGALTKLTDNWVDERFLNYGQMGFLTGFAYGFLFGFFVSLDAALAALFFAIILGNLFFGRIDSREHQLAVAGFVAAIILFGIAGVNLPILAVLAACAFADELLNEKSKSFFARYRPLLKIAALAVSLATWNWVYFLALIVFDAAYHAADIAMEKWLRKFEARYGNQLVLDFYKTRSRKLGSIAYVKSLLMELVRLTGMNAISKPLAFNYEGKNAEEGGVSGFVLIAESHIAIHTYPARELAKVDVVSCREFDADGIADFLKKEFGAAEMEKKLLARGKEYPKDLELARAQAQLDRGKL